MSSPGPIVDAALDAGLVCLTSGANVLRALHRRSSSTQTHVDQALAILREVMLNRNERHAAIPRLHCASSRSRRRRSLPTRCAAEGHDVVQTTVSRDIHELRLIKVRRDGSNTQ